MWEDAKLSFYLVALGWPLGSLSSRVSFWHYFSRHTSISLKLFRILSPDLCDFCCSPGSDLFRAPTAVSLPWSSPPAVVSRPVCRGQDCGSSRSGSVVRSVIYLFPSTFFSFVLLSPIFRAQQMAACLCTGEAVRKREGGKLRVVFTLR